MFAGGTIVFIWAFTELGTPLMFDYYKVAPVQIFWGIQEMDTSPRPYALVIVTLVISAGLYLLARVLFGGQGHAMTTRAMTGEAVRRLGYAQGLLAAIPFAIVIGLAVLPHIGVILSSLTDAGQWYRSVLPSDFTGANFRGVLTHPLASTSIRNSLLYAGLATVLGMIIGFTMSYLIVRVRVPGARLLDSMTMLPLAVPGLVLAFGYVAMSLELKPLADWLTEHGYTGLASLLQLTGQAPNPIVFLVIAYAIRRLPYVVRSVSAGLEQIAPELEEAAENLGASALYRIRRVVMPLVVPNMIAGGLLAFSFAMLEVSDSLILAQIEDHYPLTKAIYALFQRLGDGPYIASAMGVWGMALLTVTLVGASLVLGKKLGAIFRV
jgi:iron(III) transport system permease protein